MKKLFLFSILAIGFSAVMPVKAQSEKDYLVRVALNGGWTVRTGEIPSSYPDFYQDYLTSVKQGWSWGADAMFNIDNLFTIGLFYDRFAKNVVKEYQFINNNISATLEINNTYTTEYIAMSLGFMELFGQHRFSLNYLIGFMDYQIKGTYSPFYSFSCDTQYNSHYLSGHCLGHGIMVTYDYLLTHHIAIGAQCTYLIGKVEQLNNQRKYNSEIIHLDEPIVLNRISPKMGIHYYF